MKPIAGDRFYVKIPRSEVPRAETVRGRGFADVKAQRTGDSTVVSFRLQPGATAHVEQRGNKLEVVFTVPGARTLGASNPISSSRSNTGAEANRKSAEQKNAAAHTENQKALSASNKRDSATRNSTGSSPIESNSSKSSATPNPAKPSASKAAATPESLASTATPESK